MLLTNIGSPDDNHHIHTLTTCIYPQMKQSLLKPGDYQYMLATHISIED